MNIGVNILLTLEYRENLCCVIDNQLIFYIYIERKITTISFTTMMEDYILLLHPRGASPVIHQFSF